MSQSEDWGKLNYVSIDSISPHPEGGASLLQAYLQGGKRRDEGGGGLCDGRKSEIGLLSYLLPCIVRARGISLALFSSSRMHSSSKDLTNSAIAESCTDKHFYWYRTNYWHGIENRLLKHQYI